jgi:surfeit locus 1 family protein
VTQTARRRFRLRLWPTVGTLVGLAILVSLGTWQTNRFIEKLDVETERDARLGAEPIQIRSLADFEQRAASFRPVALLGELDPDYAFLFNHRVHDGTPGYWLGGVLRFADGDGAVLVNRGWVHRDEALRVAKAPPPTGTDRYRGLVHVPRRVVADTHMRERLDTGQSALDGEPTEWDTYDIEAINDALPHTMPDEPAIVVFGPEQTLHPYPIASFEHVTAPFMTSERHLGYAVFWYTTALALLAMYLAAGFGYIGSQRR